MDSSISLAVVDTDQMSRHVSPFMGHPSLKEQKLKLLFHRYMCITVTFLGVAFESRAILYVRGLFTGEKQKMDKI